jgi:hypothetical protein
MKGPMHAVQIQGDGSCVHRLFKVMDGSTNPTCFRGHGKAVDHRMTVKVGELNAAQVHEQSKKRKTSISVVK